MSRSKSKKKLSRIDTSAVLVFSSLAIVVVGIVATGLEQVSAAHEMRGLYGQLGKLQHEQDGLLEERSRLMLELGAIGSMHSIENFAAAELDMHFPEEIGQVLQ